MERKWLKILCNLDLLFGSIILIVLVFITCAAVFMRYVVKSPFLWIEEIQAFCQVWMVCFGGSVAFRLGNAITIDIFVDKMPEKLKKAVGYLGDLIVVLVLIYLIIQAREYIVQVFQRSGRATPVLRIPYSVIYGIAPYGCILMILNYFLYRYLPKIVREVEIGGGDEE